MAYTPTTWINDELPALCDYTLNKMETGIDEAHDKLVPPQYTARVSENYTDDEEAQQFSTIQAAIDYMYTTYGVVNGITIFVYPGTYTEQVHSYSGYYIHGIERNVPTSQDRPTTIYNTGADADHYPLRGEDGDVYMIQNMNIRTDADGIFGKLANNRFDECRFESGYFIDGTESVAIYEVFNRCSFLDCKAFNITGVSPKGRYIVFDQCWFGWDETLVFSSTCAAENLVVDMDLGHLSQTYLNISGNWYHFCKNLHSYGTSRHVYNTTKGVVYRGVTITNGIHFQQDPLEFKMVSCSLEDGAEMPIPDGEGDITADVAITNVNFQHNSMHNGLDGEIQILDHVKNVGGSAINKYRNITEAIKSITGDDIIILQEDQTDIPKITMPTTGRVQIRGRSMYELTFTGDIVDLGADDILIFDSCATITGGTVKVAGNNAEFHMHDCICLDSTLEVLAFSGTGAKIHIHNSCLVGPTGKSALQIDSVDPSYEISFSRIEGATGQPAVEFSVDADGKLQTKFSTFIHGDNNGNAPFVNTSGVKTDVSVYGCGMNAAWNAAHFNNLITSAGNIIDAQITY